MTAIYFLLAILFLRFILLLPIYGKEKDKWHKPPQPPEPEESFYQRYLREKETKKLINQSVKDENNQ